MIFFVHPRFLHADRPFALLFSSLLRLDLLPILSSLAAACVIAFTSLYTPKMPTLMIYGATGYTGRLASEHAKYLALDVILAGRSEDTLRSVAQGLSLPYRAFSIENPTQLETSLKGVGVLLNCAGPYYRTAKPLIAQCLHDGVHYLDVSAELDSYRICMENDEAAKRANITLMPGCGGSVSMLGCLAGHLIDKAKCDPLRIDIALRIAGSMSRGSIVSAVENLTTQCLERVDGAILEKRNQESKDFDFADGKGAVSCFPVTLPDLFTIWASTGTRNIGTFVHQASGTGFPTENIESLPTGPTAEEREASPYHASATLVSRDGTVTRAALHIVNGYTFTPIAAVEAARRILEGEAKAGYQTPAGMFGKDFAKTIRGTTIEDL